MKRPASAARRHRASARTHKTQPPRAAARASARGASDAPRLPSSGEALVAQIHALGRLPRRKSKPVGDKEVAENNLAIKFSKAKAKNLFSQEHIATLDALASVSQPGETLISDIRALGHLPRRRARPVGQQQVSENTLAHKLHSAKAHKLLSESQLAELNALACVSQPGEDLLLAEIHALGHLPRRRSRPDGDSEAAENRLAIRLYKAKAKNRLSEQQQAELAALASVSQPGEEC